MSENALIASMLLTILRDLDLVITRQTEKIEIQSNIKDFLSNPPVLPDEQTDTWMMEDENFWYT